MIALLRRITAKLSSLVVRALLRRAARRQGFLDPFPVVERLRQLAQPSEVNEPIELLRAAAVFHARGLINARAIQHNLDWIWPYWVCRQFDPFSASFITRGFSATHVNLTHRNWTALGLPGDPRLPVVDPRGLVTPHHDGWSVDAWVLEAGSSRRLVPAHSETCVQEYGVAEGVLSVRTGVQEAWATLESRAWVEAGERGPVCVIRYRASAQSAAWLALSLRPCNPEGVSPIHHIRFLASPLGWEINHRRRVRFADAPERQAISGYGEGDVSLALPEADGGTRGSCKAGMATSAALYRLPPGTERETELRIPLAERAGARSQRPSRSTAGTGEAWAPILRRVPRLEIPDKRMSRLYKQALYSLVLHSPADVYPGPFTYKRFWFRDAAFILNALLHANLHERVKRCLDSYPSRQTLSGYFHSQDGEWDSNGEALWILDRYLRVSGDSPPPSWLRSIRKGAEWIRRKRTAPRSTAAAHAGLLPSGFSAEHLGPNDYYYWDNFWSAAGLQAAARRLAETEAQREATEFRALAQDLMNCAEASLAPRRDRRPAYPQAYPASPYRRMDSGAVGSIVAAYPLQLLPPKHPRLGQTIDYLLERCMVHGGFFQENIHSGINAYLTLQIAQVLLRDGDPRFLELLDTIAQLASPTGQWPEAIHPITGGGCMGDGHHVWASAEWFMMLRNLFVREEEDRLILLSGIPEAWLQSGQELRFGPASTLFGTITVRCRGRKEQVEVSWDYQPDHRRAPLDIRVRGRSAQVLPEDAAVTSLSL